MSSPVPVPGTVRLVDAGNTLGLRHGKAKQDIVLIPQPSANPDDPLNWSRSRRLHNSIWQMLWCFFAAALISGLSPAYLLIEADTGISVADLSTGNGLLFLFLGWGTLITQPLAMNFGRRPCLIVALLGASCLTLWSAHASSKGEWYVNRILVGLFCSPQETLIELCIADVHFTHDRGFHMGFYCWALWNGAFLAPVAAGFVAETLGWRWIQYILAIIGFVISVCMFFFFEETMFFRPHVQDEFLVGTSAIDAGSSACVSAEKVVEEGPVPGSKGTSSPRITGSENGGSAGEAYNVKTYREKLKVWGLRDPKQPMTFFTFFFLPFRLLGYPTVVFSGLLVGSILAWYNVLGGTLAEVLGGGPYNFSTDMIGLTYLSSVVGVSVGCALSGWVSDILAEYLARKNKGIKEPEARLWMAIIPLVAHPLGCILYGVGAAKHIPWIGVIIGVAFMSLCLPMGSSLAITYIIDSYKELAGESIVTIILIRNTIGFAFAYAVNPMISAMGLQNTFILIAVLGVVFWSTCFVWIVIGKQMRRATASSYWRLIEAHGLVAH